MRYIISGILSFVRAIPLAAIFYILLLLLLWILKKRKFRQFRSIEFVFIVYLITILDITGIIGMQVNIKWFMNSLNAIGFYLPKSMDEAKMLILNVLLFFPLGIFVPLVFRKSEYNTVSILVAGICLSTVIEFLQMFGGRMAEFDDILMNSLGTLIGYGVFRINR